MFFVSYIDNYLQKMTMYRVILLCLGSLTIISILFGFLGILSYSGWYLTESLGIIFFSCILVNKLLAKWYGAPANVESTYITAFLLFFLLSPVSSAFDAWFVALAGGIAILSKYLIAYKYKHIFNPVAISAFILSYTAFGGAVWWVGNKMLFPFVLIGALLVIRKTKREALFFSTICLSLLVALAYALKNGLESPLEILKLHFLSWPIVFFAGFMVTEPMTLPPTKKLQIIYGTLIGALSSIPFAFPFVYSTPELALLVGNLFSFCVSLRQRVILSFVEKRKMGGNLYELVFHAPSFSFSPGQYLELTLPHKSEDTRGSRRYFTLASSPTEKNILFGIRFDENASSSFKKKLFSLSSGETISSAGLAGDFTLPKNKNKKLVFLAGGIGITPFRSMTQFLVDTNEKRDIVLFSCCRTSKDIVYENVFEKAKEIGLKRVCVMSEEKEIMGENVECGFLTEKMIQKHVPNFLERTFYISGPSSFVDASTKMLRSIGVKRKNIMTDYFPGFA